MNKFLPIIVTIAILLVLAPNLIATELTLKPEKTSVIISPEDKRDIRIFVYYDLPEELSAPGIEINWAIIEFEAEINSADFGMIDILPVASDWKDSSVISWDTPWTNSGGDYADKYHGYSITLRSSNGLKKVSSNINMMVKAWIDGYLVNNGIMIVPSEDDLQLFPCAFHLFRPHCYSCS